MQKKEGLFKKFFSLISYHEKNESKQFYIPTLGELDNYPNNKKNTDNVTNDSSKSNDDNGNKKTSHKNNQDNNNDIKNENKQNTEDGKTDKNNKDDSKLKNIKNSKIIYKKTSNHNNTAETNTSNKPNSPKKINTNNQKHISNSTKYKNIKISTAINNKSPKSNPQQNNFQQADDKIISTNIQQNIQYIKTKFNAPTNVDIVVREFTIAEKSKAFIAYIDGLIDKVVINNFILRPLLNSTKLNKNQNNQNNNETTNQDNCQLDYILQNVLEINQAKKVTVPGDVVFEILSGNCLLYIDGCDYYISNEVKSLPSRNVDKPQTESVIMGPQEAFNETLRTSISLIRKNIRNPNLTTEIMKMGKRNQSLCGIVYLNDVVNPAIVDEVKRRMASIDTDFNLGDSMMQQYIEDNPFSLVPTVLVTERPDRTISHIMEGRVAILFEGSPFSMIVPITSSALFHSPEDSFMRFPYGSFIRFTRLIAMLIAILLPSLYVALTNFHQEMIPTDLLIAIAKAKENVPFPTIVEVLLMEFSFELIREAGIRIPGIVGSTLGIIGALVLGQAAVAANIVSPILIIIVAITGLGSFAVPNFGIGLSVRMLRFAFIFIAAWLGFFGVTCLIMLLGIYLLSLKSFGVPFFAPVAPRTARSKDTLFMYPIWQQERRPDALNPLDVRRQAKISRKWTIEEPNYTYDKEDKNDKGR